MLGMFGLYFTVCALNAPPGSIDCQNRVHWFDETVQTPMQCVTVAQAQLAQWSLNHAGYRIIGWRCGAPVRLPGTRA